MKTAAAVLVPRADVPRLIPGDSPNATRPRPVAAPVLRQTPLGTTRSGIVDYIAPFATSQETSDKARLDYLLEPGDGMESSDRPA